MFLALFGFAFACPSPSPCPGCLDVSGKILVPSLFRDLNLCGLVLFF